MKNSIISEELRRFEQVLALSATTKFKRTRVRSTKNLNGYILQIGQRWRQEDELVKLLRRPAAIL